MKKSLLLLIFAIFLTLGAQIWLLGKYSIEFEWRTGSVLPVNFYRFISLGNAPLSSDILAIQLTQYFVRSAFARDELWMQKMLDVATDLDAHNWSAWAFAVNLMGFRANENRASISILLKGMSLHPEDWRFPFWISFKCYELKDFPCALDYAKRTAEFPNVPAEIQQFPAVLYLRMGNPEFALAYMDLLIQREQEGEQREILQKKREWLAGKILLESAVERYGQKFGAIPTLNDLLESGILKEIPPDPFEKGWQIHPGSGEVGAK